MKPPDDLMEWPKRELVRELQRLRAVMREHAERVADEPTSGGDIVDAAGDPHGRGTVLLDTRSAVLLDGIDVVLVDTKRDEPAAMMLMLAGRVNYANRRTKQAYLFGTDGAAGLVSELLGLAQRAGGRFGEEFAALLKQRMSEMP